MMTGGQRISGAIIDAPMLAALRGHVTDYKTPLEQDYIGGWVSYLQLGDNIQLYFSSSDGQKKMTWSSTGTVKDLRVSLDIVVDPFSDGEDHSQPPPPLPSDSQVVPGYKVAEIALALFLYHITNGHQANIRQFFAQKEKVVMDLRKKMGLHTAEEEGVLQAYAGEISQIRGNYGGYFAVGADRFLNKRDALCGYNEMCMHDFERGLKIFGGCLAGSGGGSSSITAEKNSNECRDRALIVVRPAVDKSGEMPVGRDDKERETRGIKPEAVREEPRVDPEFIAD